VTKEWGGRVSPEALTKLERFRFIAQATFRGSLSAPFALGGLRVEDVVVEKPERRPSCEGRRRGGRGAGRKAEEVAAHLDHLDDRILVALRSGRGRGDSAGHKGRRRTERPGPVRVARRPG
jgi:hypothetical protein